MEKNRKKQIKRYIAWGCAAALVVLLAVMPLLTRPDVQEDGPQASILKTQAERRSITKQCIGGGTLASSEKIELTIPQEVKVKAYLVGNGDLVTEGDPIAVVDTVSVMTAITQVQETLDHLAKDILTASKDTVSERVSAQVSGTVKHIYAREGDDVQDVMLRDGALAVLSLDDLMAVKIERETDLAIGDSVCVVLPENEEIEGTVASNLGGVLVVTVEDDGYTPGDTVKVTTEDGDRIGTGSLFIYSPWTVHGFTGTVTDVEIQEGQKVTSGKVLFHLEETGVESEYQKLINQRRKYEEMMEELFRMYGSGTITAPCDGIVSGVDEEGDYMLSDPKGWSGNLLTRILPAGNSSGSSSMGAVLLQTEIGDNTEDTENNTEDDSGDSVGDNTEGGAEDNTGDSGGSDGSDGGEDDEVPPVQEKCYWGYVAQVAEVTADGIKVLQTGYAYPIADLNELPVVSANDLTVEKVYAGIAANVGDVIWIIMDTEGVFVMTQPAAVAPNTPGGTMPGGNMSGMNGMGGMGGMSGGMGGSPVVEEFELYSLDTLTIATITSQETMELEITVDEADVLLLQVGQTAELRVSPLSGKVFEATIARISSEGANEGGRTKFTVTASTQKATDMYPGMTGSVSVVVDKAENALSLPVAALVELGTDICVYTAYDVETGTLTSPIPVTTGISDGEYVEVFGIEEGETVYYAYYDTLEPSLTPERGLF